MVTHKAQLIKIVPSEVPYGRYTHADGVVVVYLPGGDKIKGPLTVMQVNYLLDKAKDALLNGEWDK